MLTQPQQVAAFEAIISQHDLGDLLRNAAHTSMDFVHSDGLSVPVSVCHSHEVQTWVCSPLSMYIDYAQEETQRHLPRAASALVNTLLSGLNHFLRRHRFAHAAMLNNWLVSTNFYPQLPADAVKATMAQACTRYPHHALWWRSLNWQHHGDWLRLLTSLGCVLVPSRLVFLVNDLPAALTRHRDWRNDQHLLHKTPLQAVDNAHFGSEQDYADTIALYEQLYLDKYSRLNPQYTPLWVQQWHQAGLLHLQGMRDGQQRLLAVAGAIHNHQHVTTPIFGFDTALPQKMGLYRLANYLSTQYALANHKDLNMSAGADTFKQNRGAIATTEYSAVYVRHLPPAQQRAIKLVQLLGLYVGKPLLEKIH